MTGKKRTKKTSDMRYRIEVSGFSVKGPFRRRNEDNLLCGGTCLPAAHGDRDLIEGVQMSPDGRWLAVFDGVGGEAKGELASHLAAAWLAENESSSPDAAQAAAAMNRAVCRKADQEKIRRMGTTVCALQFGPDGVNGFNVGDSRCYRLSGRRMERLSKDHARYAGSPQHRLLTQYIGIEESAFLITPHAFRRDYEDGDLYMLCTDGITDVIMDRKIKDLLQADTSLAQKLDRLRSKLEKRGTPDNATVLLARVKEIA